MNFKHPPVNEVVCGVLFRPLQKLLVPHIGELWQVFRDEYPVCQEVAPLLPSVERFEEPGDSTIQLPSELPVPRSWFIHESDNGIIQVQRDRFLHNWKRVRASDEYPRYPFVIERFKEYLSAFEGYLHDRDLGEIEPIQYEMTYVNQIEQGEAWQSLKDLGKLFPDFGWRTSEDRFLPKPEQVNMRLSFPLADQAGRLHASVRSGRRRDSGEPVIWFELTVRGYPGAADRDIMWQWFDTARKWIVYGFSDLTDEDIQRRVWGKQ